MMLRDLHYGWPWAINLAYIALLLAVLLWHQYRRSSALLHERELIFVRRSRLYYTLQSGCFVAAWLAAVIALMQPLANGHYPEGGRPQSREETLRRPAHEVVLLIDASASMGVADMHNGQTRLKYVNQLADELVSELDGEQVSLYAFTSELAPLSPPTLDYLFVRMMLDQIQINEGGTAGTDFYAALADLRKRLMNTPVTILKTVVIFSDGGDTSLDAASDKGGAPDKALMTLISDMLKLNVRIFTVGMGTRAGGTVPGVTFQGKPVTAPLDAALLKQMAEAGHGKYLDANNYTVIDAAGRLASDVNELSSGAQGQDINNSVAAGDEGLIYDRYFQVPLAVAIAALLMALYLPAVRRTAAMAAALALSMLPLDAQQVRPAEVFLEAGEYGKAGGLLDALGEAKLKAWQEEALLYDKGTLFLIQGDWDGAINAYNAVAQQGDLPAELAASLHTNLGIAYLQKARMLQAMSPPPYPVILALQEGAAHAFSLAAAGPLPNSDADALRQAAAAERAAAVQKSIQMQLEGSPLQEGMPLLLYSIGQQLSDLNFVERQGIDDKSREQYLQLFKAEETQWSPLWESQGLNWQYAAIDGAKRGEGEKLFGEAQRDYLAGVRTMEQREWAAARSLLEGSSKKLTAAMRLLYGEDPLQDILQQLLGSYKRVLAQDVLSIGSLQGLQQEQEQLMGVARSEAMGRALDNLKQGIASLSKGENGDARLQVAAAQESIRRALAALQPQTPKHILEELIAQQSYAGELLTLTVKGLQRAPGPQAAEAQSSTAAAAGAFLPSVLKQQTAAYTASEGPRCQARPWDTVIPLFEEGRAAASGAQDLLKEGGREQAALQLEAKALIAWQQALAALNKPVADTSSPCGSSGGKPKESKEKSGSQGQATAPQQGSADILRVLQELNEDDQLPKTDQGIKKQGLRPW